MGYQFTFYHLRKEVQTGNDSFDFRYNHLKFTLFYGFVKGSQDKHALIFMKFHTVEQLVLEINDNFQIETYIPDLYVKIKNFFEVKSGNGSKFNLFDLYRDIDKDIHVIVPKKMDRSEIIRAYQLPDPDAIYYDGLVRHDANGDGKHTRPANRQKVQKLLPELYDVIKTRDISVRFSPTKHKNESLRQYYSDLEK